MSEEEMDCHALVRAGESSHSTSPAAASAQSSSRRRGLGAIGGGEREMREGGIGRSRIKIKSPKRRREGTRGE
eukprot:scaffold125785_cov26-Tisochrysis_lutea.AAC.3